MCNKIFKKIKKEMIDQEITYSDLANNTGYTREHLSRVLHGHIKSKKAQKAVAFALGRTFEYIWESGLTGKE